MTFIRNPFFNFFGILLLVLILAACGKAEGKSKEIRIGYQKGAVLLSLKNNEEFLKELTEKGYTVTWSEFNTGSSILEALHAGSIDFANSGDLPALFALAKGSDFQLIASEPDAPETEGIIVKKDSGIQSLEDLKGKKVAFNDASIAQYLLVKSLDTIGLTIDDIEPVHLVPSDASIAFEQGEVDAWVVWDPYMTVTENNGNTVLQTAEGIVTYRSLYLSSHEMAENHPDLVETYIKYVNQLGKEINNDVTDAANLMEEVTKVPAATWRTALKKQDWNAQYMDKEAINDLKVQAQDLLDIGLIDEPINFEEKVLSPESKD